MDNPEDNKNVGFTYNQNDDPNEQVPNALEEEVFTKSDDPLINWSSANSHYLQKSPMWYLAVSLITIVACVVVFILTKDKITTVVILISGLLMAIYGAKKPKIVNYQLTTKGFTVNGKYYQFTSFKSFAINHQDIGSVAILTPLKRFLPYSYIYFETDLEDQIASALGDVLPFEPHHNDLLENFLRKIRF